MRRLTVFLLILAMVGSPGMAISQVDAPQYAFLLFEGKDIKGNPSAAYLGYAGAVLSGTTQLDYGMYGKASLMDQKQAAMRFLQSFTTTFQQTKTANFRHSTLDGHFIDFTLTLDGLVCTTDLMITPSAQAFFDALQCGKPLQLQYLQQDVIPYVVFNAGDCKDSVCVATQATPVK